MAREAGLTEYRLAQLTGVAQPTIHRIRKKDSKNPKADTLRPLAAYFGVTMAQMMGEEPLPDGVAAGGGGRRNTGPAEPVGRVPLISWELAGRHAETADRVKTQDSFRMIQVYNTHELGERAYALTVRGDSMVNASSDPTFPEGTIIIVDPDAEPVPGKFVIARVGSGDLTFKQLLKDAGRLYLKSLNPAYPTLPTDSATEILGVVKKIAERDL